MRRKPHRDRADAGVADALKLRGFAQPQQERALLPAKGRLIAVMN
jgi:hypothetical protein